MDFKTFASECERMGFRIPRYCPSPAIGFWVLFAPPVDYLSVHAKDARAETWDELLDWLVV